MLVIPEKMQEMSVIANQCPKLFQLPHALAAAGNKPPHAQSKGGGIPGRSLAGANPGKVGSVIAQIPGKLCIADGKGVQQFVEIVTEALSVKALRAGQGIPESALHRFPGDFLQPTFRRKGGNPGGQFPALRQVRAVAAAPVSAITGAEMPLAADSSLAVHPSCVR